MGHCLAGWDGWLGEGPPLTKLSTCSGPDLMSQDVGEIKISQTVPNSREPSV